MKWRHKDLEPWIPCKSCKGALIAGPAQIYAYLENVAAPPCPNCGTQVDWWATVIAALEENFFFVKALELVGAQSTVLIETLRRDSPLEIDFGTADIPASARILAVNITPQGALFPAQLRQSYFDHDHIYHTLTLFPVTVGAQASPEEVDLAISVTWYSAPGDLESEYLFDALHAFAAETRVDQLTSSVPQWNRIVVPASQALELVIGRFVTEALKKLSIQAGRLNYSTELNTILPLVSRHLGFPLLPSHIASAVEQLRSIRNGIIHEGAPKVALKRSEAAKLLAATLFTYHYIGLARNRTGI